MSTDNEENSQEIDKTPVRLLEYYQKKIKTFEFERVQWQTKFQEVRVTQERQHKVEWELKKRNDEITQLKNDLNRSNFLLYEERNTSLIFKRKCEQAKLKDLQSKKHIAELLSITQPQQELLTQEFGHSISYQRTFQSSNFIFKAKSDLSLSRLAFGDTTKIRRGQISKTQATNNQVFFQFSKSLLQKENIRTISLANDQINMLKMQIEQLEESLEERELKTKTIINGFTEEIHKRDSIIRDLQQNGRNELELVLKEKQELEKTLVKLNQDYFAYRQTSDTKEGKREQQIQLLELKNVKLSQEIQDLQSKLERETSQKQVKQKKNVDSYEKKLKKIQKQNKSKVEIMKDQYKKVQKVYLDKVKKLEEQLVFISMKYKEMQTKKNLQIESLKYDVNRLNQALLKENRKPNNKSRMMKTYAKASQNQLRSRKKTRQKNKVHFENEDENEDEQSQSQSSTNTLNCEQLEKLKSQLYDLELKLDDQIHQ